MLYGLLKLLFRITFKVFFRTAYRNHPERLPEDGPLIICANHPGAFLDPVVIATLTKRRVYFLAKGAVFKGGFAKWLLPKLNMIPVYRQQDDPTQMHKNQETFSRCFEHLAKGGVILIFPEGISITERKLRPLKTGAARIALGAEEKYGYHLGVKIACIGLNYEDPHTFHRDVYISFSEPINALDYAEQYKKEGFVAAETLTEEIRHRLEAQMIHTHDQDTDALVRDIERLYKEELLKKLSIDKDDRQEVFALTQRMVHTVNYFRETDPDRVQRITRMARDYFRRIELLGLSDRTVNNEQEGSLFARSLGDFFYILIGFPFYLYGLLHNYIPFFLASLLSKKLVKQKEYQGAIGAAAGMFLYLVWYTALGILSWNYLHHHSPVARPGWLWLAYFASWPATGLFAWYYYRSVYYISKRWLMMSLFFKRTSLLSELVVERTAIIKEFEKAVEDRDKDTEWMKVAEKSE